MDNNKKLSNSSKELRIAYNIGTTAWQKLLRVIGIEKHKKRYSPLDIDKITKHLGNP